MANQDNTVSERIEAEAQDIGCTLETVELLLRDAAGRDHSEHLARAAHRLVKDARAAAGRIEKFALIEKRTQAGQGEQS